MPTVLITGANRGIGLEYARQFAAKGWQVIACCRNPLKAELLNDVVQEYAGQVEVFELDVISLQGVNSLAMRLADRTLDLLINNAGTFGPKGAPEGMAYQSLYFMDYGIWRNMLEVNLIAPFHIAVAFRPHLDRAEQGMIVNVSSGLASITENEMGMSYAYRSSKAGLNMVTKGMSVEWPKLIVISMSPGWCKTDLGGEHADVDPAESVREQMLTFSKLTLKDSGRFIDRRGETVPW